MPKFLEQAKHYIHCGRMHPSHRLGAADVDDHHRNHRPLQNRGPSFFAVLDELPVLAIMIFLFALAMHLLRTKKSVDSKR